MGNDCFSFQVGSENINEPSSHTFKGAALKLFQSTFLFLTIRFAEHVERGF